MRVITTRVLALLAMLTVTLAAGSLHALAEDQAAAICPPGHMGLTLHWADAQDSVFCAIAGGIKAMPVEVVGLVVRGPDGAINTVGVAPAETAAAVNTSSDTSTVTSSSRSTSTSSSTTCINGRCTTSSTQSVCTDGTCSNQP